LYYARIFECRGGLIEIPRRTTANVAQGASDARFQRPAASCAHIVRQLRKEAPAGGAKSHAVKETMGLFTKYAHIFFRIY
jgi:hypothetical protein